MNLSKKIIYYNIGHSIYYSLWLKLLVNKLLSYPGYISDKHAEQNDKAGHTNYQIVCWSFDISSLDSCFQYCVRFGEFWHSKYDFMMVKS